VQQPRCPSWPPAADQVERRGDKPDRGPESPVSKLPSGSSAAIRHAIGLARQVACHDSSVLILGESGTGKEVLAKAVHALSPRRARPFVAVNCGAIPAELLESELFGHEKGAFTGAVSARRGRFEIAEGGTLFLDEIGDMSLNMQVKLLRVLQERVFERVGNHLCIPCNVRIIAATHRNLETAIENAQFRGDLFYRLNVFPIEMPPLRARIDDLDALRL
jgi:sigma-54 specific flagellar transcriptional regulator A